MRLYLALEVIWLLLYIVAVSVIYGLNPTDEIKSDVVRLDTHLVTPLIALTIIYSKRPFLWVFPFTIFILFRESINIAEIAYYSGLRQFNVTAWQYTLFVACYQTSLSIFVFFWYLLSVQKRKYDAM